MKKFSDKLAYAISGLASPFVIIPLFSIITIYHFSPSFQHFMIYSAILVGFSTLLPLFYVALAVRRGMISDIHVAIKEQRSLPLILAICGSVLTLIVFYLIGTPKSILAMSWALFVNGVIFAALTKYWKISMHSASFASSVTIFGMLLSPIWFLLFLALPAIFWARLTRKRHSFWQLCAATIVSPLITFLILLFFK